MFQKYRQIKIIRGKVKILPPESLRITITDKDLASLSPYIISFSMFSNVWVAAVRNSNNPYDIEKLAL